MWELNDPILWEEFWCAILKLKIGKAAGLTPVSHQRRSKTYVQRQPAPHPTCNHVNDFFVGTTTDHMQWHQSQCVPVLKRGGLSNPNKWCGIVLMDVCLEIFSLVMNERAFKLINVSGPKFQFGGTLELGCHHSLFVLKSMLSSALCGICPPCKIIWNSQPQPYPQHSWTRIWHQSMSMLCCSSSSRMHMLWPHCCHQEKERSNLTPPNCRSTSQDAIL